jgi:hypothetical protein
MRFRRIESYREAWESLRKPTTGYDQIDPWYVEKIEEYGLPPGHPGWAQP